MYVSPRTAQIRNIALAVVNGAVTLIILLIAPLGLAAVIINTLLVVAASYGTGVMADRVIRFLQPSNNRATQIDTRRDEEDIRPRRNPWTDDF